MYDLIQKIKKENPEFIEKSFNIFAKKMPKLLLIMYDGEKFDNHIGTEEVAMLAEPYIKNKNDEHIGFKWKYDDVMSYAKRYVNFDDEEIEFTSYDVFVWSNVMYGDLSDITTEASSIIKHTINSLLDYDYPYFDPSHKPYCWLKKHVENEEKEEY